MKSLLIWTIRFISVPPENTRKPEKKKSWLIRGKRRRFQGEKAIFCFSSWTIVIFQERIEKNDLGIGNVSKTTAGKILDYYTSKWLSTFKHKLNINLFFWGGWGGGSYNISYCSTLKMRKEPFVFVQRSFFITLINMGA